MFLRIKNLFKKGFRPRKFFPLRKPPRLEGKVQNIGIKPRRKSKRRK